MATNGSFNTSGWSDALCPDYYTFSWSLSSQNIAENYSIINWTLTGNGGSTSGYWTNVKEKYVTVNGSTQSNSTVQTTYNGTVAFSGTSTIYHNADGTKSFSASAGGAFYYFGSYNSTGSGTWSLPTIPRASTISYGEFTMGSAGTITINRASSSFTHTLTYVFGSKSGTITTQTSNTSVSWTPSINDFASQIPNAVSGYGTFTITTYSGSTAIGSKSYTFYCNLPSSVVPTVGTITLSPQTYSYLIKGKNKLTISVSGCSAGTGSSIKSYTFSGPGVSNTTTATSITSSGSISNIGTLTYTVIVTDNRGRTASKSATIVCYDYTGPHFRLFDAYRCNASGVADDSGTYMNCTYNLAYSSINNTNDVTIKLFYKKNSATSWASTTVVTDSTSTSGNKILGSVSSSDTYSVYATVTDNYGGSSSSTPTSVFSAFRVMNITSDGTGVAFGKMSDKTNVLDSKWPIRTDNPEQTMTNLSYRGENLINSIENDTTTNWSNEGNLATVFYRTTGQITDQPSQYGLLLNLTNGPNNKEIHQLWAIQTSGSLYHRGGNANGWAGSWKEVLDSSNYTKYVPLTDYVVEQGTSGNFTYRKWNSGASEAWYRKELGQIHLTTSKAGGVYSNDTYEAVDVTLPSGLFSAPPTATGNVCSNGYTCLQVSDTTTNHVAYRIWAPYSSSPLGCVVSIQLIGRWK